jgi:hypothetical protein
VCGGDEEKHSSFLKVVRAVKDKKMRLRHASKHTLLFLFSLGNLMWFVFRTGTKPTRIVYPCQRAALSNFSMSFCFSVPLALVSVVGRTGRLLSKEGKSPSLAVSLGHCSCESWTAI